MHDLPQQPPDGQIIISTEIEESPVTHDGVTFNMIERPTLLHTKLEGQDLYDLAHFLQAKYPNGFTWEQLPSIINEIVSLISPNPEMSLKEKRAAAIETLHYFVVSTDPLYLPEKVTEPFFEALLPPFLRVAFALSHDKIDAQMVYHQEEFMEFVNALMEEYQEGINWKHLSLATQRTLNHILCYANFSETEKGEKVWMVINMLLKKSDPSHLPSHFDEKLFKTFLKGFVKLQLLSKQSNFL